MWVIYQLIGVLFTMVIPIKVMSTTPPSIEAIFWIGEDATRSCSAQTRLVPGYAVQSTNRS